MYSEEEKPDGRTTQYNTFLSVNIRIPVKLHNFLLKGTVSVILSDSPFQNLNTQFTALSLKLCLIKYKLDIHVYNFEK